jgi:hypothetical protein
MTAGQRRGQVDLKRKSRFNLTKAQQNFRIHLSTHHLEARNIRMHGKQKDDNT